jgi:peptidoglycan/xylan/chitin deacetylase (PgdA/CDA1 family)
MTQPARTFRTRLRRLGRSLARRGAATVGPHRWPARRSRLWILTYHRVLPADDPRAVDEEPGMVVTPDTLRNHVRWAKRHFELVALSEWVQHARAGHPLPLRSLAITFDDGWRDNYEFAFPVLQEQRAPATVFAVSHMIGTSEAFWPNRMARLLRTCGLHAAASATRLPWLCSAGEPDVALSPDAISRVIAACKRMSDAELRERMDEAEQRLGLGPLSPAPLMDWDQLRTMVESGLVEVGSHTCRHTRLTDETPSGIAFAEILESRTLLERRLGRPAGLFCYPNGDASPQAMALVQEHYDAAVTTSRGINRADTPAHELRRIGLHEDVSRRRHEFTARLSTWV